MEKKFFKRHTWIPAISAILILMLQISCGTNQKNVTNVYVERSPVPEITVESQQEEFPQNNCGGGNASQTLGSQTRVNRTITISSKATTGGGAEVGISDDIKLKLESEIERTYQQTYGAEESRLDEITMSAEPGTEVIYVITWEQHKYTSTVSYEVGGKTYYTNYTYTLRVPKRTDSYPGTHCPTCFISGTVYNRDNNQPIANAAITYIAADGSGYGDIVLAYTDPKGRFETTCPKIKYQHYPLRVSVSGVVSGCSSSFQTDIYLHVDERKENLVIYIPKSLMEEICAGK